ncbi:MAG TPA: hypothetical protein D7I01_07860 [Candidatus Poseidoniales archaeon]|nr:MAG TPA: hypothetical protein D7I01_07860 [Candidatus Poseidoniales archaeon]
MNRDPADLFDPYWYGSFVKMNGIPDTELIAQNWLESPLSPDHQGREQRSKRGEKVTRKENMTFRAF